MKNAQIDRDMFGHIVQSYENLQKRAEEIYSIRGNYFHQYYETLNITIYTDEVSIEASTYKCGETYDETVTFPASYLLMSDEELHEVFKKEKEDWEEHKRIEKEKALEIDRARQERFERQQLAELIKKYGKGE